MNDELASAMRRATAAVRGGEPLEATAILRGALGLGPGVAPAAGGKAAGGRATSASLALRPSSTTQEGSGAPLGDPGAAERPGLLPKMSRLRQPLGAVIKHLHGLRAPSPAKSGPDVPVAPGAKFLTRTFTGPAGSRDYRLFVPSPSPAGIRGLVVMLHGCKQDPDDFARGTDMNRIAEAAGLVVAYPAQTQRANVAACWNWFDPAHQRRGEGEPAIIAGLTRTLRDEFAVPKEKVFVAGLSAGGAMAAVMAATYPELYAAVGIHSGLAYGAARDVMSALAAMKGAPSGAAAAPGGTLPRLIVFHGSADTTVAPVNADTLVGVVEQALPASTRSTMRIAQGPGRPHVVHRLDHAGATVAELWVVDGMGHAWAGGTGAGSYTDPAGPDASAEMARFFLQA